MSFLFVNFGIRRSLSLMFSMFHPLSPLRSIFKAFWLYYYGFYDCNEHHGWGNTEKEGFALCLQLQSSRVRNGWNKMAAGRRHNNWSMSSEPYLKPHTRSRESALELAQTLKTQSLPPIHISSSKATHPKPTQTMSLTGDYACEYEWQLIQTSPQITMAF